MTADQRTLPIDGLEPLGWQAWRPPGQPAVKAVRPSGRRPRLRAGGKLLLIVLLATVIEGALRKWAFPDVTLLKYGAYFAKNGVLFLAGFAGFHAATRSHRHTVTAMFVLSLLLLLPGTLFNVTATSPVGIVVALSAFVFIPLSAFLAAGTIRSIRDVDRVAVFVGVLTLGSAILGCVQFYLPAEHVLNRYVDLNVPIATVHGYVRATGPFSYIAGLGLMGALGGWAGGYLFLSATTTGRRVFGAFIVMAGLVCCMASISRGSTLLLLGTVVIAALLFYRAKQALLFGAVSLFLLGVIVLTASRATESDRTGDSDPSGIRRVLLTRFGEGYDRERRKYGPLGRLQFIIWETTEGFSYPLGIGLGQSQRAHSLLYGRDAFFENEWAKIALEVGWPGFVGVMLWRIVALYMIWTVLRKSRDPRIRALLAMTLPYFAMMSTSYMAFMHYGNTMAWVAAATALGAISVGQKHGQAVSLSPRPKAPQRQPK